MTFAQIVLVSLACLSTGTLQPACIAEHLQPGAVAGEQNLAPQRTGEALDVVLTAEAVFAWDMATGTTLYEREADTRRPIASLSKLLSALLIRERLPLDQSVPVPPEARIAQRQGADVQLPVGEHVSVQELLAASLIPSANDAMITLAQAVADSEAAFAEAATAYGQELGLDDTKLATATGLSGGEQYSTAREVALLFEQAYDDLVLREMLATGRGTLTTQEGTKRSYVTTNRLLSTYMPIVAAKTGYTVEAGENLVVITENEAGQRIGAVILGSDGRFQDMKVLIEWIWRNYSWDT